MNIFQALKAGKAVLNPAAWKRGQVTSNMVAAVLSFVLLALKGTPYDPKMDDQTVLLIAGGIFGLVNWLFTVASTDKIGITGREVQPQPAPDPAAEADVRSGA